jgi:predicted transcriptional regulator
MMSNKSVITTYLFCKTMNQPKNNNDHSKGSVDEYRVMDYVSCILSGWLANSANACEIGEIRAYVDKVYNVVVDQIVGKRVTNGNQARIKIEETVSPDYIICLEDGKKLKMLKRHLWSRYNMTLEEYKKKWGLDYNYPTVAPNYAKRRSIIAKTIKKK